MEAGQQVCKVAGPDLIPRAHDAAFEYSGTELDSLAYARNYYSWVLRQFEPYLASRVLEVGAGLGTFSEFLLSNGRVERLITIEPGANTFPHLAARFASDSRVTVLHGYLGDHCGSLAADALAAVNVLEHVDDDARFLEEARESVVTGGALLLFVPALPGIFGSLDVAFDHKRRYTRASLHTVIEGAGWKIRRISYMNLPGIPAWFVAGRVLRKTHITPLETKVYDRLVVPWLSRLESVVPPLVGSNLIAIATRS